MIKKKRTGWEEDIMAHFQFYLKYPLGMRISMMSCHISPSGECACVRAHVIVCVCISKRAVG